LCFYLAGSENIFTIDRKRLITKKNLKKAIIKLVEFFDEKKLTNFIQDIKSERVEFLRNINFEESPKNLLNLLGIKYLVGDIKKLCISDCYFDLIVSNNTFEHINKDRLIEILAEFKRITKKGAIVSHFIDMSDHFAHKDKSITIYNFLKFSPEFWSIINNKIQPQNRLRIIDYRNIYKGLKIPINEEDDIRSDIQQLKKQKINQSFKEIPFDILAVSHVRIISVI
jgi:ubiquinone/menaquinone biosynthesis C-methylase UbiE